MKKLKDFLRKEVPVLQIPKAIAIVFLVKYSWLILAIPFFLYLLLTSGIDNERMEIMSRLLAGNDAFDKLVVVAPVVEEFKFRLPLAVFAWMKFPMELIMVLALLLSAWFGFAHGNIYNVFFQGFAGLLYSILFLKCGGLQGKPVKALLTTISAHALNNLLVLLADKFFL